MFLEKRYDPVNFECWQKEYFYSIFIVVLFWNSREFTFVIWLINYQSRSFLCPLNIKLSLLNLFISTRAALPLFFFFYHDKLHQFSSTTKIKIIPSFIIIFIRKKKKKGGTIPVDNYSTMLSNLTRRRKER